MNNNLFLPLQHGIRAFTILATVHDPFTTSHLMKAKQKNNKREREEPPSSFFPPSLSSSPSGLPTALSFSSHPCSASTAPYAAALLLSATSTPPFPAVTSLASSPPSPTLFVAARSPTPFSSLSQALTSLLSLLQTPSPLPALHRPTVKRILSLRRPPATIASISTPPSSTTLPSWDSSFISDDRTICIWDLAIVAPLKTLIEHTNYASCCSFNPQSNMIASSSFDETICIWEVKSGRCLCILPAYSKPVIAIDFNHDDNLIISSSYNGLCQIWDSATGHCMKTLIDDESPPVSSVNRRPSP